MFPNLVHLSLMRSIKSRFSLIALIILPAVAAYFLVTFIAIKRGEFFGLDAQLASEIYDTLFVNKGMYFQQGRAFDFVSSWINILLMINTIFVVCDYYKYKLRVNLEGAITFRYKFVLADISALCILSFALSILNSITLFSGLLLGETNVLLIDHPLRVLMMCIANALNIFCCVTEAYAISQLFRSKVISVAALSLEFIVSALLEDNFTDIVKNICDASGNNYSEEVYTCIAHSTSYMTMVASGSWDLDISLLRVSVVSITVKIIIAVALSVLFFSRRQEK